MNYRILYLYQDFTKNWWETQSWSFTLILGIAHLHLYVPYAPTDLDCDLGKPFCVNMAPAEGHSGCQTSRWKTNWTGWVHPGELFLTEINENYNILFTIQGESRSAICFGYASFNYGLGQDLGMRIHITNRKQMACVSHLRIHKPA